MSQVGFVSIYRFLEAKSEPIRVFAIMNDGRAVQLTSQIACIDGRSITQLGKLSANKIIIDDKVYTIVDRFVGVIEKVHPIPNGINVRGWVTDKKTFGPSTVIVATMGTTIVSKGIPTSVRNAIVHAQLNKNKKILGFCMNVPLDSNYKKLNPEHRLFALMPNGTAHPIETTS